MTNIRVNEVDLLRFLAALAVVFFHYAFRGYAADGMTVMTYPLLAPFAKYGYLGVDLFFILSGFVILMTAARESPRDFVISRAVRLYPAFWACCTITFVVTLAIGLPRYSASIKQYLVNMTMLSGFVGVRAIDDAYWSLFYELKFYAFVALILLMGRIHQAQLLLILWLIASVALKILPAGELSLFLMVDYSAYFIAGAAFFLIWSQGTTPTRIAIVVVAWALALFDAIAVRLPAMEKHYSTDFSGYVIGTAITLFFIVMLLISLKRMGLLGRQRWFLAGAITYPLYLLHHNIGFMIFNFYSPLVNPHLLFWSMVILAIGAACAVHVGVEKRMAPALKTVLTERAAILSSVAKRLQK